MKNVQVLAAAVLTLSAFGAFAADVTTTTSTTKKEATTIAAPEVKVVTPAAKKHVVHTEHKVVADKGKTDTAVTTSTTATVK